MKNIITIITTAIISISCSWVNENESGRAVFIVPMDQTSQCRKAGEISTEVKHKLGFIKRRQSKVLEELQTLARNEAVKLKANTIAAKSKPFEGKQDYIAFVCPR